MAHLSEATRRIEAPMADIWDVVTAISQYPCWVREVGAVHIIDVAEDGLARVAQLSFTTGLVRDEVVVRYEYDEARHHMSWSLVSAEQVTAMRGRYTLTPLDDAATQVAYWLDIEPKLPVHKALREKVTARIIAAALDALEERVTGP